MVKFILKILIIIALAITAAIFSVDGPGHVIILISNYRLDLSLISLCIAVILFYILVYYLAHFLANILHLPNNIRKWREKKSSSQGRGYINNAGINYFEGKFDASYKQSMQSYAKEPDKDNQFLALMFAYKSASHMLNYEKEQTVLARLNEYQDKKWQMAKFMATAKNQYILYKYGLCLDNLKMVLQLDKKHIPARNLMLKVYLKLNNFDKAYEVLEWLIKHDQQETTYAEKYKLRIYQGLFENSTDSIGLQQIYSNLDKRDKENNLIKQYYLEALIRLKEYAGAIELLKTCTDASFLDENMVLLAKKLEDGQDAQSLIKVYENLLLTNKQNSKLLLAMGILSCILQQWGNGKSYIESSILLKPTLYGYLYLFLIGEKTNNPELTLHARQNLLADIATL